MCVVDRSQDVGSLALNKSTAPLPFFLFSSSGSSPLSPFHAFTLPLVAKPVVVVSLPLLLVCKCASLTTSTLRLFSTWREKRNFDSDKSATSSSRRESAPRLA